MSNAISQSDPDLRAMLQMRAALLRLQEKLDDYLCALESRALSDRGDGGARKESALGRSHRKILEREALRGTGDFVVVTREDGHARVRIDGVVLRLTRDLASFLEFLASGDAGADGIVEWKPVPRILDWLANGSEATPTKGCLDEKVSRLRRQLCDAAVNPFLVQTDAELGKRFALRRRPPSDLPDF